MATNEYVLRLTVRRIIPLGLALGASMEAFMWATGFWKVATKNAAERQVEAKQSREAIRAASAARQAQLHGALGFGDAAAAAGAGKDGDGQGKGMQ